MANVLAELFRNVASAIREKTGESGTMKPAEFPDKIREIEAGSSSGSANLIPLTVTKNGKYYPSESFEFGKPFMFKSSYTQAELQMLAAMGTAPDGISYLYEKGDSYLVIMFLGDIRVLVYTTSATEGYAYTEADISEMGLSAGWNTRSGDAYITVTTPPSITFDASGTLHITDMSAIGLLFNVQNCDGFSEVTVNVASGGGSGELVPLKVTKNGMYYPTKNVEVGGTYTFKDSYTQEELQALHSKSTNIVNETTAILISSIGTLGIMYQYGMYIPYYYGYTWVPGELAPQIGSTEGWHQGEDLTSMVKVDAPTFTSSEYYDLYVDDITSLNVLFELPSADGFSSVEVDIEATLEGVDGYGLHTVSFYNHDGTFLCSRPVFTGNDCGDPIVLEQIATPVKPETVAEKYTYNGWDGSLENVVENRSLTAKYMTAKQKYNIYFYDGATLINTMSVPYGTVPAPTTPTKAGYKFIGWTPALAAVTGEASYSATWEALPAFATATWADIARVSASGEATTLFKVGDVRTETINGEEVDFEIVGFNHDDLSDGTGKAGITIMSKTLLSEKRCMDTNSMTTTTEAWGNCDMRTWMQGTLFTQLPSALQSVIKEVNKPYDKLSKIYTSKDKLWIPSTIELNNPCTVPSRLSLVTDGQGTVYDLYKNKTAAAARKNVKGASSYAGYCTRSKYKQTGTKDEVKGFHAISYNDGGIYSVMQDDELNICFGFCV